MSAGLIADVAVTRNQPEGITPADSAADHEGAELSFQDALAQTSQTSEAKGESTKGGEEQTGQAAARGTGVVENVAVVAETATAAAGNATEEVQARTPAEPTRGENEVGVKLQPTGARSESAGSAEAPPRNAEFSNDNSQQSSNNEQQPFEERAAATRGPRVEAPELGLRADAPVTSQAPQARDVQIATGPTRVLPELPPHNETQIIERIRLLFEEGGGRARIQLHPPQLGELGIRLTLTNDSVQINVVSDRAGVAELIARHLPELRQALEAQGLQMDRVQVDVRQRDDSPESRSRDLAGGDPRDPSGNSNGAGAHSQGGGEGPTILQRSALYSLGTVDVHV